MADGGASGGGRNASAAGGGGGPPSALRRGGPKEYPPATIFRIFREEAEADALIDGIAALVPLGSSFSAMIVPAPPVEGEEHDPSLQMVVATIDLGADPSTRPDMRRILSAACAKGWRMCDQEAAKVWNACVRIAGGRTVCSMLTKLQPAVEFPITPVVAAGRVKYYDPMYVGGRYTGPMTKQGETPHTVITTREPTPGSTPRTGRPANALLPATNAPETAKLITFARTQRAAIVAAHPDWTVEQTDAEVSRVVLEQMRRIMGPGPRPNIEHILPHVLERSRQAGGGGRRKTRRRTRHRRRARTTRRR